MGSGCGGLRRGAARASCVSGTATALCDGAGRGCGGGRPRLLYRHVHVRRGRLEDRCHLADVLVSLLEEVVLVYAAQGWGWGEGLGEGRRLRIGSRVWLLARVWVKANRRYRGG